METKCRIITLVVIMTTIFSITRYMGWDEYFHIVRLQQTVANAGYFGYGIFILAFSLGLLVQLPGLGFVAVGVLAYGKVEGGLLAYFGGVTALLVSFVVVRSIGGQSLSKTENKFVVRTMAQLADFPLRTVILTRIFVQFNPPVNYALAMSNVSIRHYLVGSLIGLAPVIIVFTLLFDWLIDWL